MARAFVGAEAKMSTQPQINQCQQRDIRLIKTSVTQLIKNPIYLPIKEELLKDFYLIRGEWQERWTYDACGKVFSMMVDFQADGMGGAGRIFR